jgi:hypothetical protein
LAEGVKMNHWILDELDQICIFAELNNFTALAEDIKKLRANHHYLNIIQRVATKKKKKGVIH